MLNVKGQTYKYGLGPTPFVDGVVSIDRLNSFLDYSDPGATDPAIHVRQSNVKSQVSNVKNKTVFRFIFNTLVYLLIVGGIIGGLPRFLAWKLNTEFPLAAITSGSMWPELKIGSLVFVQGIAGRDAKVGDIIVFKNRANGTFTIHRVIELKKDTLITKGDANFDPDPPVGYEDVIGRTVNIFGGPAQIPYVGGITVFASNLK
jgi:signal peptidase I